MDKDVIKPAIAALIARIDSTLVQDGEGFPHYADVDTGRWVRTPGGDWTGGFWVGMLWLAAWKTGDSKYREAATDWALRLGPRAASKSVFKGFLFWYGAGIGAELFSDPVAQALASAGAEGLRDMYNLKAGLIPLGADAEEAGEVGNDKANIDALPGTLALLMMKEGVSGAADIAHHHLQRHLGFCVRSDGSVCQSAVFNPDDGALLRRYTHKGVTHDSTWGRAQTWAMLGMAQAMARGDVSCREIAIKVADWWVGHLPADDVAYWDFDDPAIPVAPRDTSATAIGAASLLKLAELIPERSQVYRQVAMASAAELIGKYLIPTGAADRRQVGILTQGCFNQKLKFATANELIFGDYFLLESLLVLDQSLVATRI